MIGIYTDLACTQRVRPVMLWSNVAINGTTTLDIDSVTSDLLPTDVDHLLVRPHNLDNAAAWAVSTGLSALEDATIYPGIAHPTLGTVTISAVTGVCTRTNGLNFPYDIRIVPANPLLMGVRGRQGRKVMSKCRVYVKSLYNREYKNCLVRTDYYDQSYAADTIVPPTSVIGSEANARQGMFSGTVVRGLFNDPGDAKYAKNKHLVLEGTYLGVIIDVDTVTGNVLLDRKDFSFEEVTGKTAIIVTPTDFEYSLDDITWEKVLTFPVINSTPVPIYIRTFKTILDQPKKVLAVNVVVMGEEFQAA